MNFKIPEKSKGCKLSEIRAVIARGATIPDFISLALGNPAAEAIPVTEIQQAADFVMRESAMDVLQYGPALGDEKLKKWIKERLVTQKHMPEKGQTVIVTSGAGQALGLIARAFTEPEDEVYAETFSYPSALNAVRCAGARIVGIPIDEKGMIPEALEQAAKSGKGRYLYLNPTFQNPTGFTMPLERRKEIYEVAKNNGLLILEDDPYGEIRFKGNPVPAFKSIDDEGIVLYVGSYSKTLSAGLRVGYIYADDRYADPLASVKNNMDGELPLYNQKIVLHTLEHMDYEKHLDHVCDIYGRKCKAMRDILIEESSSKVKISDPDGGMFIWVELPKEINVEAFSERLYAHAVGAVKSSAFASDMEMPGHAFRLNYTSLPVEKMIEGAKRFADVTVEMCGK